MPVVTVIGGSNRPFSVPFSGRRTNTLGRQFERSFAVEARGRSTAIDSVGGAGSSSSETNITSGTSGTLSQSGGTARIGDNASVTDTSAGGNTIHAGINDTLSGGVRDTISAAGNFQVNNGSSNSITVNGPLTFLGGSGDTTLQSQNATIYGTAHSTYHYVGTHAGNTQLYYNDNSANMAGVTRFNDTDPNKGGHILFDASSSHGSLVANVGKNDTVVGGSASDTISVNNMTDGNGAATLSGGSGAPNLFQFLNDKGGQYTITDFGSAAGNTVGISSSQMGNIQHILDTASVSGGDTTISLDDQTKITFLNDTHLKPNDFHGF